MLDLPEWSEEFTDNLEDTEVPALANTSQDSDSERPTIVASREHSIYAKFPKDRNCEVCKRTKTTWAPCRKRNGEAVPRAENISVYTHFPKDPNCDICLKTKTTRASCRRRTGTVVPRAEHFGDLITADHNVLNEEGEPRNNHRYAAVAQDLATQWVQSYPCRTTTSQETVKRVRKILEPSEKPKVIHTGNSLEFGKSCEDLSWNHRTSTPDRSETNGIAERAVRRIKEETSAVLLQSGLDEKWWADSVECYCYLRNVQDLLAGGKTLHERRFGEPFKGLAVVSDFCTSPVKAPPIWQESFARHIPRICIDRGRNLERRYSGRRH